MRDRERESQRDRGTPEPARPDFNQIEETDRYKVKIWVMSSLVCYGGIKKGESTRQISMATDHSSIKEVATVRNKTPEEGDNLVGDRENTRGQWEPLSPLICLGHGSKPASLPLRAPFPP